MSDSDKALLAAAAMRAKKNAIDQGKGLSVTAKVRALGQAGFTDSEIDRIMAVEAEGSVPAADDKAEYNQQVDETLKYAKWHTAFVVIVVLGFFLSIFLPVDNELGFWISMSWVGGCIAIGAFFSIPFYFKKADYFLKR